MQLGFPEMIFLFLLGLIIFGPKKLPEIGRQIGRAMYEFKRASNEFKTQIESEIANLEVPTEKQITNYLEAPSGTVAANTSSSEPASPAPDSNAAAAKAPDA